MHKNKIGTVSLCMIVKNEEKDLPRCLESVKDLVDEMIIVDTGSTDKTIEISKSFGAKVYNFKWINDFSAARNESLKYASCNWILLMDADDEFCQEDKAAFFNIINNSTSDVYYFETHNYVGTHASSNISINLNLRLFKNNSGYYFSNAIHEQFRNDKIEAEIPSGIPVTISDIKIYHYGYLLKEVNEKNKRNRNMSIIREQIKKEPHELFHYFNLGSEYFALDDYKNAIMNFNIAYNKFNPNLGYSSKMILRMILSYYYMDNFDEALKIADIGLKHYPNFTDIEFLKGMIFEAQDKIILAIGSYSKCIAMGAAPPELKFIQGIENFRSFEALANIYFNAEDYKTSYDYEIKCLEQKPDYISPLYMIINIYKKQNLSLNEIKTLMEKYFTNLPNQSLILCDIFYTGEYYETSLEYLELYLKNNEKEYDNLIYLRLKCMLRLSKYNECIKYADQTKTSNIYYFEISMLKILCLIITNNLSLADIILNQFEVHKAELSVSNQKVLKVYRNLFNIFTKNQLVVLSEDETDLDYSYAIFSILDILINNNEFEAFQKCLAILNTISDKKVLLELGELYYKYNFNNIAKNTILQSIREYDVLDKKSLSLLKKLI